MIAIDWFGPYSLDEAHLAARNDFEHGLYLCLGKTAYQRNTSVQYVGIGNALHVRLHKHHHKLQKVTKSRQIWLGEIATSEPSGKKLKVTKTTLDLAEWLHARFLRLPLNEKKTKTLPSRSVSVMNRWFRRDYETPWKRRPHPDWPDLIDFPSYGMPARLVWFGGKQRLILGPRYADPD